MTSNIYYELRIYEGYEIYRVDSEKFELLKDARKKARELKDSDYKIRFIIIYQINEAEKLAITGKRFIDIIS